MKISPFFPLLALPLLSPAAQISFDLQSHPDAVALQFDVVSTTAEPLDLAPPQLDVTSPHTVESGKVSSGATRYVVYSTVGQTISTGGKVRVTFQSNRPLANGMLVVTGVVASNASGAKIDGVQPNALPVLSAPAGGYRSAQTGQPTTLSAAVVDPDGSVSFVNHIVGGQSKGIAAAPFSILWTPDAPGLFAWSALATDNRGGSISLDLGSIRAYQPGDISSFAAFGQIHYGSAANPAWYGFDADPLGLGIDNGIAYLLGINPNNPDRSRLPRGSIESHNGQPHFVFRFVRNTGASGVTWDVWQSGDLNEWFETLPGEITQTALGNGLTEVLVRRPLSSIPEGRIFMQLEAKE